MVDLKKGWMECVATSIHITVRCTPGRNASSGDYRYGFNGMEKDNEVKNITGSSYDFGARMYDSRLGRWFSVDPQFKKQPGWSTYKAFLDNPIFFVDPEGETEYGTIKVHNEKTGKTKIFTYTAPNLMTDGVKHEVATMGGGYTLENRYYDYETTINYTIDKDGNVSKTVSKDIIYSTDYKDADYVWSDGESHGHTKLDVADYLHRKTRKDGADLNSKHQNYTDEGGPDGKPPYSKEESSPSKSNDGISNEDTIVPAYNRVILLNDKGKMSGWEDNYTTDTINKKDYDGKIKVKTVTTEKK